MNLKELRNYIDSFPDDATVVISWNIYDEGEYEGQNSTEDVEITGLSSDGEKVTGILISEKEPDL